METIHEDGVKAPSRRGTTNRATNRPYEREEEDGLHVLGALLDLFLRFILLPLPRVEVEERAVHEIQQRI